MAIKKRSKLKEYIENTHKIRKLSSPPIDGIDSADDYRKVLFDNFTLIGKLSNKNNKILDSYLYKILEEDHLLSEEEKIDLWEFSNSLQDAETMETLNEVLRFRVVNRLLDDAKKKKDIKEIILSLDAIVETSFALMHSTSRISPVENYAYKYRAKGLKAANTLLGYLKEDKFKKLPDDQCKKIVLVNSRYISSLFDRSDNYSDEINKHDFDCMRRALALKDNPFYIKEAPNYDWRYHELRTLQYITNFTEENNVRGFKKKELKEIQKHTNRLKELWYSDKEYFSKYLTEAMLEFYVYRINYLCGDISLDEYAEELFKIIPSNKTEIFNVHTNTTYLLAFAEYLGAIKNKKINDKDKKRLEYMYRNIIHYVDKAPKSGSFLFMLSFLVAILNGYIECGNRQREFENFCLELMVALHPPTYVHSSNVADISVIIAKKMFKYKPESFIGFLGCKTIEDVNAKEKEILEFIYHSVLCHDVGKLFVADTIITYERRLLPEDFDIIKSHSTIGAYILEKHKDTKQYASVAKYHHVWYDSSKGYPSEDISKLKEKVIIDIARVADCMDASTDSVGRSYKKGLTLEQYYKELHEGYNTNYAGYVIDVLEIPEVKEEINKILEKNREFNYFKAYKILDGTDHRSI